MVICKVDANGDYRWSKTFDVAGLNDYGYSIAKTSDGGYVLAGACQWPDQTGTDYDCYIVKTDANGNSQWANDAGAAGTNLNEYAYSVVQTFDGGYAFAGVNYWQNGGQATLYKGPVVSRAR
jgi:hypothetical protein